MISFNAAVQKRGYVDLHEMAKEDTSSCHYGSTLPKDSTCSLPCSWTETDPSTFLIRGLTYLDDRKKVRFHLIQLSHFAYHKHVLVQLLWSRSLN